MVINVFVAQHEAEQALGDQMLEEVFAAAGVAVVVEAAGEALGEAAMVGEGKIGTGRGFGHDASEPIQDPDSKHINIS